MNDLITIGIPIYNVEKYVEKALLSALDQTYDNIEFIIVDDKGTDNSMNIVRSIIESHSRSKYVRIIEHDYNIGLGAGRNTAIESASGKYIYFMDSDDEIVLDCIKILYKKMQEEAVDFITASIDRRDRSGRLLVESIQKDRHITGSENIVSDYFINKNRRVSVWNKLYDVSFLRRNNIKCIPTHLNEDNLFTFQVILNAESCKYISDITYHFFDTPDSITKATDNNRLSQKYAKQYTESIEFKRKYIQNYKDLINRECVFRYIIFQTIHYVTLIKKSNILNRKEKREYIKKLTIFPLGISDIKKFKNKRFFYIMYVIYSLPFTSYCFRFIKYISSFRQKK